MRTRKESTTVASYALLILYAIITLVPLYWLVVGSLQPHAEMYSPNPVVFPREASLDNFISIFRETSVARWFLNSSIVSGGAIVVGLFVCSLTGYVFAIYSFKGKQALFWLVLASVTIPEIVMIIPVYRLMISIGLIDSHLSLILPYSMNIFGIFFLKQYFQMSVPIELIHSARVDGAGEFLIYYKIALPLAAPGLGVMTIFLWLNSWINYFWPLIMIRSNEMFTLPLGLATLYANPWDLDYGQLMAGSVIATIPIAALFLFVQDFFVAGLTAGAVKN